jgi:phosphatidylserine/phosphatidylglycerophosphate/cardiolipin synthase-like enzyme
MCADLIGRAKEFCVIHSAFWSEQGIAQYEDAIHGALTRGVDIYLLRGLEENEAQYGEFESVRRLRLVAERSEGRLVTSAKSQQSHAKFVVADGVSTIVSSFNFLGATVENRQLNIGVYCQKVPHPEYGPGMRILREVLLRRPVEEGLDELETHFHRMELARNAPRSMTGEALIQTDSSEHLKRWFEALRTPAAAWELVTDDSHRDALLNALYSAERSVIVTAGDLRRSAVDAVFTSYVEAAIKRGVAVTIAWGSQTRDPLEQQEMIAFAGEWSKQFASSPLLRINSAPCPIHAKLLIVDGWVSIVSSYNFLSYRGLRLGASEVGLKLFSSPIARDLSYLVESAIQGGS